MVQFVLFDSTKNKAELQPGQERSVWIMERGAPAGEDLFVVCPNVSSRIGGKSASLSRFGLPVNDNPIEETTWARWSNTKHGEDELEFVYTEIQPGVPVKTFS